MSRSSHGAITGRGQQDVGVGLVIAFQHARLTGAGQRPHFSTTVQDTCCFQLKAGDLGEIPVELQYFFRLHHLEPVTDDRQRRFGIRAIQHLGIRVGQDLAQRASGISHVANRAFLDLPVEAGLPGPDFEWLIGGEFIPQAMPRGLANVGHLLDQMSHGVTP